MMMCLATSCEKPDFSTAGKQKELIVYTRSGEGEQLIYPLELFAFAADGRCLSRQVFQEKDGNSFSMKLPSGTYHITALGGTTACEIPDKVAANSTFSLKTPCKSPVQMGRADITLGDKNAKAYLQMQYLVSSINVRLERVPSEATAATISLANTCQKWSFAGTGSNASVQTFALYQDELGDNWESDSIYILPTSEATTLTINITTADGNNSYAYTCPEPLKSGVPYQIRGTFTGGEMVLEGEFAAQGWGDTVEWQFFFGAGASPNQPQPPTQQGQPVVGQLWQGHIVAHVEDLNDTEWSVLLLSRHEEEGMPSALSTNGDPDKALDFAASYTEDDLTGWGIPTKEEAQLLQKTLGGDQLIALNTILTQAKLPLFYDYEPGKPTEKARYLCDAGTKSFTMASTDTPTKTGTSRTYRLRLVKTLLVKK